MAELRDTQTTALTVGGSGVWTTANNNGSDMTADKIAGYNIEFLNVWQRTKYLGLFGTYSDSTFYPLIISGLSNDKGVTEVDLRRTSVHQDGSGKGAYFGTFRYRADGYNFWEAKENWGWGTRNPFVANMQVSQSDTKSVIWVKGGLGYYTKFSNWDKFEDTSSASSKSFDGGSVSTTTSTSIPNTAMYLQHNVCAQGWSLGQTDFRHSTVYTVNAINTSSDRRFKEDIQDLDFGKRLVLELQPKSYTLKQMPHQTDEAAAMELDDRRHHGLVAQDVKQSMERAGIDPDTHTMLNNKNDNHWSLEYDQFTVLCVKAVQEQYADLDDIDKRLAKLEEIV
jgi:hypothetical protein